MDKIYTDAHVFQPTTVSTFHDGFYFIFTFSNGCLCFGVITQIFLCQTILISNPIVAEIEFEDGSEYVSGIVGKI